MLCLVTTSLLYDNIQCFTYVGIRMALIVIWKTLTENKEYLTQTN